MSDRLRRRHLDRNGSYRGARNVLRIVGPLLLGIGGLCLIVAMVDFFSSFGSFEPPKLFWMAFIGIPLLGIGGAMTQYGYLGAMSRYVANEAAPVAKDTFNYVAQGTEEGMRSVGRSIGAGLREAASGSEAPSPSTVRCRKCDATNDADARFCDNCGAAMPGPATCPSCKAVNDTDARFCDACGTRLSQ